MESLERILHVDDEDDIRLVVRMALELVGGYSVKQCASGFEALEVAESFMPQLFLLDVMMPGMTGEETWQKLQKNPALKDVPAIFLTAKAEKGFTQKLLATGALAVMIKPFDVDGLCHEIEAHWVAQQAGPE